jgi:thioredoxin
MITIIDFYADWCGPCQIISPTLEKLEGEYAGKIKVEKVNVDQDQTRAQRDGIMSIPTLVMMKDGKEISRKIGLAPEPVLRSWIDGNL